MAQPRAPAFPCAFASASLPLSSQSPPLTLWPLFPFSFSLAHHNSFSRSITKIVFAIRTTIPDEPPKCCAPRVHSRVTRAPVVALSKRRRSTKDVKEHKLYCNNVQSGANSRHVLSKQETGIQLTTTVCLQAVTLS